MIQIDMEMPESCHKCPFRESNYDNDTGWCSAERTTEIAYRANGFWDVDEPPIERPDWCPLMEVKNETKNRK